MYKFRSVLRASQQMQVLSSNQTQNNSNSAKMLIGLASAAFLLAST